MESKIAEPMEEKQFWQIIAESQKAAPASADGQIAFIEKKLESLPLSQIVSFRLRTDKLLFDSYNSHLWCAAYLANGGCSDDGFEYFRLWLILRGRDTFCAVCENPDELEKFADGEILDCEDFWYAADNAFEKLTGKDLHDFVSEDFAECELNYPEIEFDWSEENSESMRAICPKLYAKMRG